MNEYDKQAFDFLRKFNVRLKITRPDTQEPAPWADGQSGYKYNVTMTTERGAYMFPFWDSIANRQSGKLPTRYDVLAALMVWEGSIDDFVAEFGYDDQPISKVLTTYNAVIDQSLQLKHILNTKALEALQEIA